MRAGPRAVQGSPSNKSGKFTSGSRIAGPRGFDRIVCGESVSDRCFRLFFVKNKEGHARLGVIVGKAALFRAVERNRVKRGVREAFRRHPIKERELDLVVMLKRGAIQRGCNNLSSNLKTLFSRVDSRCAEF